MEVNKRKVFWLDLIFFLVLLALGAYFFYKSTPPANAPGSGNVVTSTSEVSSGLPEGVTVEDLGDGNKLVKNEKDGYQVKINKDEYVYKNPEGNLKIQNYEEPKEAYAGSGGCVVSFSKSKSKNIESLKEEENSYCKDIIGPDCEYSKVEENSFNGFKWFKIFSHGTFIGTDNPQYVTYKDENMYILYFSCVDKTFISETLNNFTF